MAANIFESFTDDSVNSLVHTPEYVLGEFDIETKKFAEHLRFHWIAKHKYANIKFDTFKDLKDFYEFLKECMEKIEDAG